MYKRINKLDGYLPFCCKESDILEKRNFSNKYCHNRFVAYIKNEVKNFFLNTLFIDNFHKQFHQIKSINI